MCLNGGDFEEEFMDVYIIAGIRTPGGSFLGPLSNTPAPRLGACALSGVIDRAKLSPEQVDEILMGQVLPAGVGQAPARQAALFAGLPESVPCTTINKVCGSGMQTIILGASSIRIGDNRLVLAGGMENMSLTPHLVPGSRQGIRFGEGQFKDSLLWDGLWDVYSERPMGNCAEECVQKYGFSREEQDEFARQSFSRAKTAQEKGIFAREIVSVKTRRGNVEQDDGPSKANFEKMKTLRPAFDKDGTITAANASTLSDGAAALALGGEEYRSQAKFKIVAWAGHAQNPTWFTTAPAEAMKKCLAKAKLSVSDIDLFEINEAFAAVTMAAIRELELDRERVNIHGGAISLGHPLGCSGTRIVVTLMNAMEECQSQYGMASLCIGGGEALALLIERMS